MGGQFDLQRMVADLLQPPSLSHFEQEKVRRGKGSLQGRTSSVSKMSVTKLVIRLAGVVREMI